MKSKITYLIVSIASIFNLDAQIPNASFENWTGNDPDGWFTYNAAFAGIVTQVTDHHAGTKAVRLNVINYFGSNVAGSIFSGDASNTFFPITSAPAALHGWYKFFQTIPTEELAISSLVKDAGNYTGVAAGSITANTTVWTEFAFNYNYISTVIADSAYILITLTEPDSVRHGTYAIIDDLSFGPAVSTGLNELNKVSLLEPCSPNPYSQSVNLIYRVSGNSKVSLALFDMKGQIVKRLLENVNHSTGRFKVEADVSDLADGIYYGRLDVDGKSYTQKIIVSRANR